MQRNHLIIILLIVIVAGILLLFLNIAQDESSAHAAPICQVTSWSFATGLDQSRYASHDSVNGHAFIGQSTCDESPIGHLHVVLGGIMPTSLAIHKVNSQNVDQGEQDPSVCSFAPDAIFCDLPLQRGVVYQVRFQGRAPQTAGAATFTFWTEAITDPGVLATRSHPFTIQNTMFLPVVVGEG